VTLVAPAYLLLVAGHALAYPWSEREEDGAAPAVDLVSRLDADSLPEQLGPWRRQDFQVVKRGVGNYFGENSLVWSYRNGDRTALFSLDYPFPSWHDLTRCYTGQGWRIQEESLHQADEVPGGFVATRLKKPAYRNGYLLFCEYTARREPLQARHGAARLSLFRHGVAARSLWNRLAGAASKDRHSGTAGEATRATEPADPPGPVYQWQLMVESSVPTTRADEEVLRDLFARARTLLKKGEQ
jgi:hypothetical protein